MGEPEVVAPTPAPGQGGGEPTLRVVPAAEVEVVAAPAVAPDPGPEVTADQPVAEAVDAPADERLDAPADAPVDEPVPDAAGGAPPPAAAPAAAPAPSVTNVLAAAAFSLAAHRRFGTPNDPAEVRDVVLEIKRARDARNEIPYLAAEGLIRAVTGEPHLMGEVSPHLVVPLQTLITSALVDDALTEEADRQAFARDAFALAEQWRAAGG